VNGVIALFQIEFWHRVCKHMICIGVAMLLIATFIADDRLAIVLANTGGPLMGAGIVLFSTKVRDDSKRDS
jgi:uncharacterized membrane protein YgdD (TMEM256/DUF423 family)